MATPPGNLVDLRPPVICWHLEILGSFALKHPNGHDIELRGRKAQAIVAYLAAHLGEHVTRDRLAELLWPDRDDSQARGSLRQSLLEIRRKAKSLIGTDQQHVWILSRNIHVRNPEHLSGDEILFGDLDGITTEFDDWLRRERAQQSSREWWDLYRKVEGKLSQGDGPGALPLIERMQRIDPYNEDWLRFAMCAEFLAEHPAGIQTRFREMKGLLKRDLDVNVSAKTCAMRDELLIELSRVAEALHASGPGLQELIRRGRDDFGSI
jgi:DNA-binding SARP family transcriptional activator